MKTVELENATKTPLLAQGLQEQAAKIQRELAEHRKTMASVSSRFEEACAGSALGLHKPE